MESILLINHIEVGKIEIDTMSGLIQPYLNTFIEDLDYGVFMIDYQYDLMKETLKVKYLLSEYDEDFELDQQSFWVFDSEGDINSNNYKDYYQLNEVEE